MSATHRLMWCCLAALKPRCFLKAFVFLAFLAACAGPTAEPTPLASPILTVTQSVKPPTAAPVLPATAAQTSTPAGILPVPASENAFTPTAILPTTSAIPTAAPGPVRLSPNRQRLESDLRRLTGEEAICGTDGCQTLLNRKTGSQGLAWAKEYVAAELGTLGYSVERLPWTKAGYAEENILARKTGTSLPDELVIFVAHLDGIAEDRQARFPAADDNASGAAAILEIARLLSEGDFPRTAVFFFSTGEEQGALGVKYYLDSLSGAELGRIQSVLNLDMIGYDADQDSGMQFFHGGHAPSAVLANEIARLAVEQEIRLEVAVAEGCG